MFDSSAHRSLQNLSRLGASGMVALLCLLLLPGTSIAAKGHGPDGSGGEPGRTETNGETTTVAVPTPTNPTPTPPPAADALSASREARCLGGGQVEISLLARNGWIEIRAVIRSVPPTSRWRIIVSHDRWLIWVGRKSANESGRVSLRVKNKDYDGPDAIMVRANGPDGEVCRVVATVTPPA
jgi:hypothetical protein